LQQIAGDEQTSLVLCVDQVAHDTIECTVQEACTLTVNAKMTMHGSSVHSQLPILREDDKEKICKLCPYGVHYVALSYCRNAADIYTVRDFLDQCVSLSFSRAACYA
jgi:pyruvate kinase